MKQSVLETGSAQSSVDTAPLRVSVVAGRMFILPRHDPREFRKGVEKDSRRGAAEKQSAEVRELKQRNRLLEQANEVLRRTVAYPS